jgi:hypothetical protein
MLGELPWMRFDINLAGMKPISAMTILRRIVFNTSYRYNLIRSDNDL